MKWILSLVILCVVIDFIVLYNSVKNSVDVFTPGLYVVLLFFVTIYAFAATYFIKKYSWVDERPVLSFFILFPCIVYLLIHLIALVVNIASYGI